MNADKIPFPDKRPPLPLQSLFGTKPESTRQKALESRARVMEFASTIPKPLAKVKREVSFSNDESQAAGQVRGARATPSARRLRSVRRPATHAVSGTLGVGNPGCQAHAQSRPRFGNTQPASHLIGGPRLRNIVLPSGGYCYAYVTINAAAVCQLCCWPAPPPSTQQRLYSRGRCLKFAWCMNDTEQQGVYE
jgi:hypothetical protein